MTSDLALNNITPVRPMKSIWWLHIIDPTGSGITFLTQIKLKSSLQIYWSFSPTHLHRCVSSEECVRLQIHLNIFYGENGEMYNMNLWMSHQLIHIH